jgi:subtilisin family serine protease
VRRAVLATFLCAAPLFAASAQASTGMLEREAVRQALSQSPRAASNGVVPLPLPEPARASAASTRGELASIARSSARERLLIGARTHADLDGLAAKVRRLGAEPELFTTIGALAATVPSGAAAAASLRDDTRVAYIERDRTLSVAADPFDSVDLNTGLKYTWAYDAVRAGEALATVGGGSSRVVSVIDTGLDVNHPEFEGQVVRVFDTSSGGSDVRDFVGHGTFVSGLISALDGNGRGGKGVAGTTKLIAIRASIDGSFTISDLVRGVEFSVRRGAAVINLSLAGDIAPFTRTQVRTLQAVFFNGALPVAAAGNNAQNGNPLEFPAVLVGGRRGGPGVGLSVAATAPDGSVAAFSNHNDFVSLAAPGAAAGGNCRFGVFSTLPANTTEWDDPQQSCNDVFNDGTARYAYGEGTSFAAPIVSGLAALAWQAERRLTSTQVADVMVRSANGGGWNEFTGAGVVDGKKAVDIAATYDVVAPRARGKIRRQGNRAKVTVARTRDRTEAGDELAGALSYAVLVSRDNGRNFSVLRERRRPFSVSVRIRGRKVNRIFSSVCDGNFNCDDKLLGRFKRR